MSETPKGLLYTKEHEWVRVEGDIATVGITDYAQETLGEVTYVEFPELGATVTQDDEAGAVESSKAAASVYAPVSGTILEANRALEHEPNRVNADPYGEGWIYKIELDDRTELEPLLSPRQYARLIAPQASKP